MTAYPPSQPPLRVPPALAVADLAFSYGGLPTIDGVSFTVAPGEFVGLIGPNGSGKSTLLRICVGLLRPARGEIRLFGHTPDRFRQRYRLGYVPQRSGAPLAFPASVEEVVSIGRTPRRGLLRPLTGEDRRIVDQCLAWLHLEGLRRRLVSNLSGGEYQRVMIARALAGEPSLLLLDEPATGLDAATRLDLLQLLALRCRTDGLAVVYVSHDLEALHAHVTQVALLNRRLLFFGPPDALLEQPDLRHEVHEAAIIADHYAQREGARR